MIPTLVTLMCFLHLLSQLFVDFVFYQPRSHCHQSSSESSIGRIIHTMMMTFMVTPFWRARVLTWKNTRRRNSWISTWSHWIRMTWQSAARHRSWTYAISHNRWVLDGVGMKSWCRCTGVHWVHRCRWSRKGPIGGCKAVPRWVGRV